MVLTLALTPQTRGLIGREELEAMDERAWLVNVARGALVGTAALAEALRSDQIGGAAAGHELAGLVDPDLGY